MGATKVVQAEGEVDVMEIAIQGPAKLTLEIEGVTPLLQSRYIDGKETPETPEAIKAYVMERLHRNADGDVCIPSNAFAEAIAEAPDQLAGKKINKTFTRRAVRVPGGLLPLHYESITVHTCTGRRPPRTGTPATIHRAQINEWSVTVPVLYNAEVLTKAEIVQLVVAAGYAGAGSGRITASSCGIGMRMFRITAIKEG